MSIEEHLFIFSDLIKEEALQEQYDIGVFCSVFSLVSTNIIDGVSSNFRSVKWLLKSSLLTLMIFFSDCNFGHFIARSRSQDVKYHVAECLALPLSLPSWSESFW